MGTHKNSSKYAFQFDPVTKKFRTALRGVKEGGNLTTHTGQKFDEGDFRVNRFLGGKVRVESPSEEVLEP